jgi:hypothetical protein
VLNLLRGCTGLGTELETTVDQAPIRGLGTAFRVFVSRLSAASVRLLNVKRAFTAAA